MIVFAKEGQSIVDVVLQFTGGLDLLMHIISANPPLTIESYPGSGTPIFIDNSFVQQSATLNEIRRRQIVIQSNDQDGFAPTPTPGVDPDAQNAINYLDAQGYTPPANVENEIDTLIKALKAANIYSIHWDGYSAGAGVAIIDALYLYLGNLSAPAAMNLADPRDLDAAYRAAFTGGWSFSVNGAKGNGVNGYHRTFLTDSLLSATTERWFGFGSKSDTNPTAAVDGGKGAGGQLQRLQARSSGNALVELYSPQQSVAVANSLGNYLAYRNAAGFLYFDKNNVNLFTGTLSTGALTTANEYIVGATNNSLTSTISAGFYSDRIFTHWVFGRNYLSLAQAAAFNAAISAFNSAIRP